MAAQYDPTAVEAAWYDWWAANDVFKPSGEDAADKFSMVLPPPNVTGALHIGHALTVTVEDALVRWNRMHGRDVVWVPGLDHAGIATQSVVERSMAAAGEGSRHTLGRDVFVDRVWEWYKAYGGRINDQLRSVGASLDWSKGVFTLDDDHSDAVREAFVRLHKDGLVYRGHRMVNWCPHLQTVISDIEVDVLQVDSPLAFSAADGSSALLGVMHTFAYPLAEGSGVLHVSTTRLETMLGDVAVAVHPDDPRYAHLIGQHVIHPFHDTKLPIIGDAELVDPELGTGVVKITPAHDPNDFECGRRHGLPEMCMLNDDGTLNDVGGPFSGMGRFDARAAVKDALDARGLFVAEEAHPMAIAKCSRSGDVLEPMLKPQWYVRCTDGLGAMAADMVREGSLVIRPADQEQSWFRWLDDIQDWCVSRQLWWGHRIPAFRVSGCTPAEEASLRESPSVVDADGLWVVAASEADAQAAVAAALPRSTSHLTLTQDEDVLDTWFSSALFPLTVFGWPRGGGALDLSPALQRFYPLNIMETGHDILFFWVARMAMVCTHLTGTPPFKEVWLHPIVRDSTGRKMSKSLGNVVDPLDVINGTSQDAMQAVVAAATLSAAERATSSANIAKQFPKGIPQCGADALRFTLASQLQAGAQVNMDVARVVTNRLFCNKLWNAARFTMHHVGDTAPPLSPHLPVVDQWVLSRLAAACTEVDTGLATFDLGRAATALSKFALADLCEVYVEYCKSVFAGVGGDPAASCAVLHAVMDNLMRALHPFMPYLSEELWQRVHRTGLEGGTEAAPTTLAPSVALAPFPTHDEWLLRQVSPDADRAMASFVTALHAARAVVKTGTDVLKTNRKSCDVVLLCEDDNLLAFLSAHAAHFEHMLHAGGVRVEAASYWVHTRHLRQAAGRACVAVLPLPEAGSVGDAVADAVQRLGAQRDKLAVGYEKAEAALAHLQRDARVPAVAIEKAEARLAAAKADFEAVGTTLSQLTTL